MKIYLFPMLILALFTSCKGQNDMIDKTIARLDKLDMSGLKNTSVYYRSSGISPDSKIYFVNYYKGSCSPYVVEVSNKDSLVVKINRDLVMKSCGKDYYTDDEIKKIINLYLKTGVCLVQVDSNGNVYVNPNKQEPPTLLRNNTDVNANKDFSQYKGNWYSK